MDNFIWQLFYDNNIIFYNNTNKIRGICEEDGDKSSTKLDKYLSKHA